MGEFIYTEHPKGCSLQLFYRTSPCKERGSARSAKTTNPVRNVALPVPVGSNRFTIIFCCMGEFIYTEHPEGCSLRLFYRTSPCKERGSARSAMGASRLPSQFVVWVNLFTRNTQRDVPYSCSTVRNPVRNVALPVPQKPPTS